MAEEMGHRKERPGEMNSSEGPKKRITKVNNHGDNMQRNTSKYSNLGLSLVLMLTTAQVWGAEAEMPAPAPTPPAKSTTASQPNVARQEDPAELAAVLTKLDRKMLDQNEQDIRAWLDARIAATGDFGVYSFGYDSVKVQGDTAKVDLNRGALADSAVQFIRAYEMLGEKKYLEAGLKTADFFLQVQQPAGHFPTGATIERGGKATTGGGKCPLYEVRMEDGYQFRPFALLMYAHRLTGEKKYFEAAKKLADLVTQRIQHPEWGWCPTEFDTRSQGASDKQQESNGTYGVRGGGSYADACTTDGFRISVIMYHATGDKGYLKRSAMLGKWLFATQLGQGEVRGWADNYNSKNEPVPARNFEGLSIDPRNFNRYTATLLTWFYAMSGEEKYRKLFMESHTWLKAQEQPDGWAAEYSYDGHPVWTQDHKTYRYDQPATWPEKIMHVEVRDGKPWYYRAKVQLDDSKIIHDLIQKGGRENLLQWHKGPARFSDAQFLAARLAAAQRCTDEQLLVPLQNLTDPGKQPAIHGNYLERVRLRLAAPDAAGLPTSDSIGRREMTRQSWHSPHTWAEPYHPPFGWASWQYVWDARLALGLIKAETVATGGRGLEIMHLWPAWDVMGDWTTRCIEVENWLDVPVAGMLLVRPQELAAEAGYRRLPVAEFRDKMQGAWLGQMIGVGWGAPTEKGPVSGHFSTEGCIMAEGRMPPWKPGMINQHKNDDCYVEMTFMKTLETYGFDVSIRQAGLDFANIPNSMAHANRAGRDNLRAGIAPPDSSHPQFNKHADDIDYQLEADFSGIVSPGMPKQAIALGDIFGRLMNYGDGRYAGQFIGGMYAEAYFESDMLKIIEAGLACVPADSQYAEMVRDMLKWYKENPTDWQQTWQLVEDKYHKDPRYTHGLCSQPGGQDGFSIDAKLNGAFVIMGLLYGKGDADQTMRIACRCGQDSDCNPANAAGVYFTILGAAKIPGRFTEKLDLQAKYRNSDYTVPKVYEVSEMLVRKAVVRAGGKIEKDANGAEVFVIPVQTAQPGKAEKSHEPGPIANSRFTAEEMAKIGTEAPTTKK
jgi:hypothetical protein